MAEVYFKDFMAYQGLGDISHSTPLIEKAHDLLPMVSDDDPIKKDVLCAYRMRATVPTPLPTRL